MNTFISMLLSNVLFVSVSLIQKKPYVYVQPKNEQNIAQKINQIKTTYKKLIDSDYSKEAQKEYFDAFPSSFDLFVEVFGEEDIYKQYPDEEPKPPPYIPFEPILDSWPFINVFFKLSSIDKQIYLKRIINIFIGSTFWDYEGISDFQYMAKEKIYESFELFHSILKTHSKKRIKSFWHFYFSGLAPGHPEKVKDYNQLIKKLNTLDKDMVPVVKEAYTTEKEYWEKP